MARASHFLALLSALLVALSLPALADLERRKSSGKSSNDSPGGGGPLSHKQKESHHAVPPANEGLKCDTDGPLDFWNCCKVPDGPFSIRLTEESFPRGKCFVYDTDSIDFSWTVVPEISSGHLPSTRLTREHKSPPNGIVQPVIGYHEPTAPDPARSLNIYPALEAPTGACISAGKMTYKLSKASIINPSFFYGYSDGMNSGWSPFIISPGPPGNVSDYHYLDGLDPPTNPFEGFVLSDAAGCKRYYEDLKASGGSPAGGGGSSSGGGSGGSGGGGSSGGGSGGSGGGSGGDSGQGSGGGSGGGHHQKAHHSSGHHGGQ